MKMYESKYGKLKMIGLIVAIVIIVGVLAFFGIKYFVLDKKDSLPGESGNGENLGRGIVEDKNPVSGGSGDQEPGSGGDISGIEIPQNPDDGTGSGSSGGNTSSGTAKKQTYQGYDVSGRIEIPKTSVDLKIFTDDNSTTLNMGAVLLYNTGEALNKPGNATIVSHNYKNGKLFADNKKLSVDDVIYITDLYGNRMKYTIYKKYETTPEDATYMKRDTDGACEISLSTCNDDGTKRLIIWAKAE